MLFEPIPQRLIRDLTRNLVRAFTGRDGSTVATPSEYVEVVVVKQ